MNHAVIIHAWGETPNSCWYQWLKQTLEARGMTVEIPAMPKPDAPELGSWVGQLQEIMPSPTSNMLLIGHSVGCQTILRYLSRLNNGQIIGGVIMVAPWTHLTNLSEASQWVAKPWLETPINWSDAKKHCQQFTALFSSDDKWVPLSEELIFKNKLDAQTQVISKLGHFDTKTELPEIVPLIEKLI